MVALLLPVFINSLIVNWVNKKIIYNVFYDFGIKLKLIKNGVKLLPKITFFIKGHFSMTFYCYLKTSDPINSDPKTSDPQKIKLKKTENHNLELFQL